MARLLFVLIAACIFAAAFYFYFLAGVDVRAVQHQRIASIHNYPQAENEQKVFLGDRFRLYVDVKNNGIRSYRHLPLRVEFLFPVDIVAVNDVETAAFQKGCYPESCAHKNFTFTIDALAPFEQRTETLIVRAYQAGNWTADAVVERAGKKSATLKLPIMSRPVDAIPRTPSDMVSYLGDKAVENCMKNFPCKTRTPAGSCKEYPDSAESKKCLIDENRRLFDVCGEGPQTNAAVDAWSACLFEKYGFATPKQE